MRRDATKVIWRTVVFAGAMLGAPACTKNKPQNAAKPTEPATPATTATDKPADPPQTGEDPCAGRIRGADDDGGGGAGRGFVLS